MADNREKVRRRILLAVGGANEHESRNAALKACKLLHENNMFGLFDVVASTSTPEDPFSNLEDLFRAAGFGRRPYRRASTPQPVPPTYPREREYVHPPSTPFDGEVFVAPPPQPEVAGGVSEVRAHDPDAKVVPIVEPTWCTGCKQRMRYNTTGIWSRGEVWHSTCLTVATATSKGT
jgi:hypothetical protein